MGKNAGKSKWVFSTCVEVIPFNPRITTTARSILHVCGGDPTKLNQVTSKNEYSPRVWR